MKRIVIRGGRRLEGSINISGAKNAALPIIAASLLTREKVVLDNIPKLGDVQTMIELVRSINAKIGFIDSNTIEIKADKLSVNALSDNILVSKVRYSLHLIGALLSRFPLVRIPLPGGCKIGTRRIDSFMLGLTKLGAKIDVKSGHIQAKVDELQGCRIKLMYPSVCATENILMAGCLARGNTIVENVAREPEIVDLANFLNSMGANISGAGSNIITIKGVEKLEGTEYSVIPDRVETGTYMVAVAITNGDVLLRNTDVGLLKSVVLKLREVGVKIEEVDSGVRVTSSGNPLPVDIVTEVYPGFPTDMQPIITPLLSLANGKSTIKETIFLSRFNHVPELRKMGALIRLGKGMMFIKGVNELKGANVNALDIRSGGSLVISGLNAKKETVIDNAYEIFRGYENLVEKLNSVGAKLYTTDY